MVDVLMMGKAVLTAIQYRNNAFVSKYFHLKTTISGN